MSIEDARPDSAEPTEDHDREDEELLAPVHVTELAVERRGDRRGQDVRGDHPGQVRDAAQVTDDPRQRGAHDKLVEHGEQHRHQQARQDNHDLLMGQERGLPASCPASRRVLVGRSLGTDAR
jgi:hypothetical protein